MNSKILSLSMAAISALSAVTPALAVEQHSGDGNNVPVELTVEKPTFSVTVPTGLPVAVDAAGKVYCSTTATIKNNTFGQVKVSNVTIEGNQPWTVADWATDMQKEKVNTAKIAMQLNNGNTTASGYDFQEVNFPVMDGHASLPLIYDAKLPAQTKVIGGDTVANVVFTVGWNTNDDSISLNGISLDHKMLTLNKGSNADLHVTFDPENTTEPKEIQWASDHSDIVSVVDGHLVANDWGKATITATVGAHTAQCVVTVPQVISGVTLSEHDITIENGTQHKLIATTKYRNKPAWSVIEGNCVTVNDGTVTAKAPGTAKIQVQVGDFKDTCTIHVTQKLNGIHLNKGETKIKMGTTEKLFVSYDPENTTDSKNVSWKVIKGSKYLSVNNGLLTPIAPGVSVVEARVGDLTDYCTVTIDKENPKSVDAPVSTLMMSYCLSNLTGKLSFSREPAPSDGVIPLNSDGSVVVKVTGQDATIYSRHGGGVAAPADCSYMFLKAKPSSENNFSKNPYEITALDLDGLDTRNVTNMEGMFYGTKATKLDLSKFDTSSATNMDSMFFSANTKTLDLSNFDTSRVVNMQNMFCNAKAIDVDISKLNTSNVTNMNGMFAITSIKEIDCSSFDTRKVNFMVNMFADTKADLIDIDSFDTSHVEYMSSMFQNSLIKTLDLSSFDMSKVKDTSLMFSNAATTKVYCRTQTDLNKMKSSSSCTATGFIVGKP